jgi:hypothetical protein
MDNFITHTNPSFDEIQLFIYDAENIHYGGNQYWFPSKMHQLSGCGPVAAANITSYLSQTFPHRFANLYPYQGKFNKKDFVGHMIQIRKYVRPGMFGLTSAQQFSENVLSFSNTKGITLIPHILDENTAAMEDAIQFIVQALYQRLPVAILVLKHPVKELEEYAWHWMTITHLTLDPTNDKYYISVSTYGERRVIDLDLLWNHRRPQDIIRLVYFN